MVQEHTVQSADAGPDELASGIPRSPGSYLVQGYVLGGDVVMREIMTETKKSNHQVKLVRISEVLPHPNADKLEIIRIDGYQAVVKKGDFLPGTLGVYIQPDSVVPQTVPFRFLWEQYVAVDPNVGTVTVPVEPGIVVPERKRRITVRKFRGEWSEGLLLPLSDFPDLQNQPAQSYSVKPYTYVIEGQDVSEILGITHYDPDKGTESTGGTTQAAPRYKRPKTLRAWFWFVWRWIQGDKRQFISFPAPVYDVEAWKNYKNAIPEGTQVHVTEKIHGSNARYVYLDGVMYAGSRNLWKAPDSGCVWRKALQQNSWIESVCKANPGYILYGEVTPTQKGFDYGTKTGEVKFHLFDVRTPKGEWLPRTEYPSLERIWEMTYSDHVPCVYEGPFTETIVKSFVDGQSLVADTKHIREGIVVRPVVEEHVTGLGRPQLKIVSNLFLERDSK